LLSLSFGTVWIEIEAELEGRDDVGSLSFGTVWIEMRMWLLVKKLILVTVLRDGVD